MTAATVWCVDCAGASDVTDEALEDIVWGDQVVGTAWVRRLDCGHEEVTERHETRRDQGGFDALVQGG